MTEPQYIRGYERLVRNATVKIDIPDEQGDPRRLVEIAKERMTAAAAAAARSGDAFLAYDEVWVVFDRDEHLRFHDACQMARDNEIQLAVSNACFELWLLLHFRESPGAQTRHELRRMLSRFLPGYDKHLDFPKLARGVEAAHGRARKLDADAAAVDEEGRNPTTTVYRLTESIAGRDDP